MSSNCRLETGSNRSLCFRILPIHCTIKLEGGVSWLHPQPGALCLVNASPVDAPVRLSQGCVIVLGKTNMFRYNDPREAADLRKTMTEKTRKASLMNQSLMSQSLSDLRYDTSRLLTETDNNVQEPDKQTQRGVEDVCK